MSEQSHGDLKIHIWKQIQGSHESIVEVPSQKIADIFELGGAQRIGVRWDPKKDETLIIMKIHESKVNSVINILRELKGNDENLMEY